VKTFSKPDLKSIRLLIGVVVRSKGVFSELRKLVAQPVFSSMAGMDLHLPTAIFKVKAGAPDSNFLRR